LPIPDKNDFVLKSSLRWRVRGLTVKKAALFQNAGTEFVEWCCVRYRRLQVFKKIIDRDAKPTA
jgi:hypothetical protein